MTVITMKSSEARSRLGVLLDTVTSNHSVIIERYNKRVAVAIPYEVFVALQQELEDAVVTSDKQIPAKASDPTTSKGEQP